VAKRAILRFDVSTTIGAGHAVRSRAIGRALSSFGFDACEAPGPGPGVSPAALRAAYPEGCDVLLTDGYALDAAFESECRGWAKRVAALDDAPGRTHDCDVLIDSAPGRRAAGYAAFVPPGTAVCAGAAYAPLRPEFPRARHAAAAARADRVFVSFGAADPGDSTTPAIEAARAIGLKVRAALGRLAPHASAVRARFANDADVEIAVDPPDMAAAMADCGFAIGAGGVSALERCCLGLASVVVPIAANQRDNAAALAQAGAAIAIERADLRGLSAALTRVQTDRVAMAARAAGVCDGYGAARAAAAVAGLAARDGSAIAFRPVRESDSDDLLAWRRDPAIAARSRNPDPPTADGHARWLAAKLADRARLFEIAEIGGRPAGVVRLDRRDPHGGGASCYEVSVFAVPGMSGNGVGAAMLAFARAAVPWAALVAEVLPGNDASHALFARAGYVRRDGLYFNEPDRDRR
jgi:spore coat polysaccharide biosynthesis predicted glycosyltransferase SpsG/RimJ/RimL family protein N-acetyltransferase